LATTVEHLLDPSVILLLAEITNTINMAQLSWLCYLI